MEEQLVDAAMQISEQRKRIQALEEETQLQRAAIASLEDKLRQAVEAGQREETAHEEALALAKTAAAADSASAVEAACARLRDEHEAGLESQRRAITEEGEKLFNEHLASRESEIARLREELAAAQAAGGGVAAAGDVTVEDAAETKAASPEPTAAGRWFGIGSKRRRGAAAN